MIFGVYWVKQKIFKLISPALFKIWLLENLRSRTWLPFAALAVRLLDSVVSQHLVGLNLTVFCLRAAGGLPEGLHWAAGCHSENIFSRDRDAGSGWPNLNRPEAAFPTVRTRLWVSHTPTHTRHTASTSTAFPPRAPRTGDETAASRAGPHLRGEGPWVR